MRPQYHAPAYNNKKQKAVREVLNGWIGPSIAGVGGKVNSFPEATEHRKMGNGMYLLRMTERAL